MYIAVAIFQPELAPLHELNLQQIFVVAGEHYYTVLLYMKEMMMMNDNYKTESDTIFPSEQKVTTSKKEILKGNRLGQLLLSRNNPSGNIETKYLERPIIYNTNKLEETISPISKEEHSPSTVSLPRIFNLTEVDTTFDHTPSRNRNLSFSKNSPLFEIEEEKLLEVNVSIAIFIRLGIHLTL